VFGDKVHWGSADLADHLSSILQCVTLFKNLKNQKLKNIVKQSAWKTRVTIEHQRKQPVVENFGRTFVVRISHHSMCLSKKLSSDTRI
jgi:hypothetical protein